MPGVDKRLARDPQLYSRIGFAHEHRQSTPEELTAVLAIRLPPEDEAADDGPAHAKAITTIIWILGGFFRLVDRQPTRIERVPTVHSFTGLTPEIVDTVWPVCSSAIERCENQATYRCDSHSRQIDGSGATFL